MKPPTRAQYPVVDSGHRTGKSRQVGGKGVRIAETVGWCSAGGREPQRRLGLVARWTEICVSEGSVCCSCRPQKGSPEELS